MCKYVYTERQTGGQRMVAASREKAPGPVAEKDKRGPGKGALIPVL